MTVSTTAARTILAGNGSATTFAFSFPITAASDLVVTKVSSAGVETTLTITTDYTVSVSSFPGSGSVSYPVSGDELATGESLVIQRTIGLTQATDLQNQGSFFAQTHEDVFDRLTMLDQQEQDEINRSLKAPVGDPTTIDMELPAKADRLGKYLAFNVTTGNPEAGASSDDVATLAAVTDDIATLADIEDGTDATDAIQAVAAKATEVGRLGTADAVADLAILGTADVVTDMNVLATADVVTDMNTLGTADVVSDMNTLGTADVVTDMNTLATADIVSDMNDLAPVATEIGRLGTADAVSDMNTLATAAIVTDMDLLATSGNVTAMGLLGTSANVTAMGLLGVSGVITDMGILGTADVVTDMNVLATADVVTDMNVLATADVVTDMNVLATADVVTDMNVLATADVVTDMNVLATADVVTDMNVLATADVVVDMNTLGTADVVSDMNTLAAIAAGINNVASQAIGNTFSVNTVMTDGSASELRFNNSTIASCTAIMIDDLDTAGADVSPYILTWDDSTNTNKGTLLIRNGASSTTFAIFTLTALTDNSGWNQLTVTHVASNGTFSNDDIIFTSFIPSGNKGADGAGAMDDFIAAADSGANQTISDGNTLQLTGGDGITTTASATDTVTFAAALKANGGIVVESNVLAVDLAASSITNTLAAGDGGTGRSTLTANYALLGNGTSAVQMVAPGSSGNLLTSNGSTWASTTPAAGGAGYFLGGASGATGDTTNGLEDIFRVNSATVDNSCTIAANTNANATGPLTVSTGVTVTVTGTLVVI